jgi:glycosyltransferase involved in cell wall biosynthesis
MNSKVVVLIPAYNPRFEEFVATLRSVLEQTHQADICVVDDGSLQEVVSPFGDPRISVLRLPVNGGITRALKHGVEHCVKMGYAYICRLDVGDISYPHRISRQMEFMESNLHIDLLGAYSRVTDLEGRVLFLHGVSGGYRLVHNYLWKNSPFKHSTFCIRSSALLKHGSYNCSFNGAEDYELLLRFSQNGVVECLDDVLVDYIEDPSGLSSKKRGLQLRMRLKAQLTHCAPNIEWCIGVLRTVVTLAIPRVLARKATLYFWGAKGAVS